MRYLVLFIMMLFALQASSCPGGRPEAKKSDLISKLILSVKKNKINDVQTCLDQHAGPNMLDAYDRPLLHWACYFSKNGKDIANECIINTLLKAGARIDTKDKDGWIPLDWAYKASNGSAIKQLIQKAIELRNLNLRGCGGKTLLHYAAISKDKEAPELVKQLLELGLDPNAKDHNGHTPLDDDENNHIKVKLFSIPA